MRFVSSSAFTEDEDETSSGAFRVGRIRKKVPGEKHRERRELGVLDRHRLREGGPVS
jgi:hypothetical protein